MILRPATPYEYTQRLNWQNEVFGDDLRIEGIHEHNGALGLSISQRTIDGIEPSQAEIHCNMEGRGFKKVPASTFNNQHISDKTWYDPRSRVLVSDAKPDNFKKDQEGGVVPIDLLIQKIAGRQRPSRHIDRGFEQLLALITGSPFRKLIPFLSSPILSAAA